VSFGEKVLTFTSPYFVVCKAKPIKAGAYAQWHCNLLLSVSSPAIRLIGLPKKDGCNMFRFKFKKQVKPAELKLSAACGCNIGLVRGNNEDNLFFNGITLPSDNRGLSDTLYYCAPIADPVHFGVFDGMGGEALGEIASYLAATEIQELPRATPAAELVGALLRANEAICAAARSHERALIGTTAALLSVDPGQTHITNVGDSRVYRFHAGVLEQLSVDHTDRAVIEQHGLTNRKPRLTQHLGIDPADMVIEPAVCTQATLAGDRYVLCSDGLTDMVTEDTIAAVLAENLPPARCVERLTAMALENGGKDNVTIIVVAID